jgi:deoxyribodipyrimidine photo-lyase
MSYCHPTFSDRASLIAYVKEMSPWAAGEVSPILGGYSAMKERLDQLDPVTYGRNRNYLDGAVSKLSAYIRHGVITLREVLDEAKKKGSPEEIYKFVQELAWRDHWQRIYKAHPEWIWEDIEPYKTGYKAHEYAFDLPDEIKEGKTKVACIDHFCKTLIETGYLHNHARMYLASYIVHWRRIRWQAGAQWFLEHLLDGDPASNNLSWQWVASTFSNKPYIFNLQNVQKYASKDIDTSIENNQVLAASYEELHERLFKQ